MENLNIAIVFLAGITSFFSPCIVPILPIYLTILSGSTGEEISKSKGIINTLMFVLGISTAFFLLGNAINLASNVLIQNKIWIALGGGVLVILLGLFYMEVITIPALQRERKLQLKPQTMNPIVAYILGFTFSFGWTPCIGPMLTMVFVMTSQSETMLLGNIYIGVYTLGFMIPFIMLAILSDKLSKQYDYIKKHMLEIKKIGGVIMIVAGGIVILSGIQEFNQMQNVPRNDSVVVETERDEEEPDVVEAEKENEEEAETIDENTPIPAYDFTLTDQYDETHTLSEYKDKVIFLNFWATWCPPCRAEMPDIQNVYEMYGENSEDVIILGVAFPELGNEVDEEGIKMFLDEEGYTFPVVFDETGILAAAYYIQAFPTTYIINKEGNIEGYVPGAIPEEFMIEIIENAR